MKPRDDIARALNAVAAAWEAVHRAAEAEQMLASAERTARGRRAKRPLSVMADAVAYKETGEIIAVDDIDLAEGDLEVVELELDAATFARVMDAAADSFDADEREAAEEAARLELEAQAVQEDCKRLEGQHDFFSGDGCSDNDYEEEEDLSYVERADKRYGGILPPEDMLAAWEADQQDAEALVHLMEDASETASELQDEAEWRRSRADEARSGAARMRRAARGARTLVAVREVEAEARRGAAAAIAKARKRVTAAALGQDGDALSDDRTTEMLGRFAGLIGDAYVQRLSDAPET